MPSKLPSIKVRLPKTEKSAATKAAKTEGRSASSWVRQLIRKALGLPTG